MNLLSWAEIYLVSVVLITVESPYYGLMEVFFKRITIHSKHFPNYDWLKAHA